MNLIQIRDFCWLTSDNDFRCTSDALKIETRTKNHSYSQIRMKQDQIARLPHTNAVNAYVQDVNKSID